MIKTVIQLQYAYIGLGQCYFFQCLVRTNGKRVFPIGWGSHTIVTAGLEHTVSSAFTRVRIPLIDCTIHTTGHYLTVVREPGDGLDPSTVTFKVGDTFKGGGRENLNDITCNSCKEMSSIAECTLKENGIQLNLSCLRTFPICKSTLSCDFDILNSFHMYLFACAHGKFFECSDVIYQ